MARLGGSTATRTVTLQNKTLTDPAINGTVTTTGLTLPAFTGVSATLNQGAGDGAILTGQSSDVSHGLTSGSGIPHGTNDYYSMRKLFANEGGLRLVAIAEDGGSATQTLQLAAYGGTANTGVLNAGLVNIFVSEHNGANAIANVTANGKVFSIQVRRGGGNPVVLALDVNGKLELGGGLTLNGYLTLFNTDTDAAVEGALWYDASENKLKFFNGSTVETVTST